jgi:hypothetical protein
MLRCATLRAALVCLWHSDIIISNVHWRRLVLWKLVQM